MSSPFDPSGYTSGEITVHIGQVKSNQDPDFAGRCQVVFAHDPQGASNQRWCRMVNSNHFPQTVNSRNDGKQGTGIIPGGGIQPDAWVYAMSLDKDNEMYTILGTVNSSRKSENDTSGQNDTIPHGRPVDKGGGDQRYKVTELAYDQNRSTPGWGMQGSQAKFGDTTCKEIQSGQCFTVGRNYQYA